MKFGHMILRKIFKFVATSGQSQILRLKRTKFDFGWGCTPDPSGGAYSAPPDPLRGFKCPSNGGEEVGNGRWSAEEKIGKGRRRRGGREREGTPKVWFTFPYLKS